MRLREREGELAAVEALLAGRGGMLLLEGRAGMGKTSLVEAACSRADELGHEVVHARGSELESGFAFGVVRQLFERRLAGGAEGEREALLAGPAGAVRPLLSGQFAAQPAGDSSFAVLHGLYWLVVNDSWTDAHIGVWYGPQVQADAAVVRRIQAAVAGQPTPSPDPAERLRSAAFHAARTDADIAVALRRMLHLVARPDEVLGNPAVVSQLRALVNARPELTAVAAGPTREELAA